jgi:hypothetical protein
MVACITLHCYRLGNIDIQLMAMADTQEAEAAEAVEKLQIRFVLSLFSKVSWP